MARRLATVYVKTHIRLTEAEMIEFVELFRKNRIHIHVRVYENGNHEVVLENGIDPDITLSFERHQDVYIFNGSCRFYQAAQTNAMRKAISVFKGTAIVHRQYHNFTMEYCYERGVVVRIVERRAGGYERVVYRYKNTLAEMEALFNKQDVERDIEQVRNEINAMLDLRKTLDHSRVAEVDEKLAVLSRRLFALEA